MRKLYIGLDVHKASISIAVAFLGREEALSHGKCSSNIDRVELVLRRLLKKYEVTREEVSLCYEAGPCGFALARHLVRQGYEVSVVAPSLTPVRPGERIKTDPRDARKLAQLFRAGELTVVHIPDVADEVIRDVCRARTDAVEDTMRNRQRLCAFLLRNGYHYTGKSHWTEPHKRYLREMVMQERTQKLVLEDYLQAIDRGEERVGQLREQMSTLRESWSRRPWVEALQGLRGFQLVASMVIVSELGDLTRFEHPRQLMAYLGLVPGEHSSGERRRQGSITKCGNSHARWMLIEVAQHYRLAPKVSKQLSVRQEGLSRNVRALAWRAQLRLHKRHVRLTMRGLHHNKVTVAIARELVGFIWELARLVEQEQHGRRRAA